MKLKIEHAVGETWELYDMDGDYEEILALVTELGYCNNAVANNTNIVANDNTSSFATSNLLSDIVRNAIISKGE